ncbi:hypothetical protein TIFTF001_048749 [Ficus carica]|uniref:Uncharacterized protein n=1 Tax=Ficus carica TaxID=3494 RepID=A0AA87YQI1_FICCA|nr:hypothetical protein TIFTF001_048743 [Ficus carica]GMN20426.1 hypothetical protein TIFTF001_048745 [Ficus carica]GMN20433.1 hypothetical protein TIFTF001_048747 [Ficus carica]GMN20448.1 hypothetical protein TIFTF001_048749 [Ficus carica]
MSHFFSSSSHVRDWWLQDDLVYSSGSDRWSLQSELGRLLNPSYISWQQRISPAQSSRDAVTLVTCLSIRSSENGRLHTNLKLRNEIDSLMSPPPDCDSHSYY